MQFRPRMPLGSKRSAGGIIAAAASACLGAGSAASGDADPGRWVPEGEVGAPFMRVAEHGDGMRLDLEMGVRAYRPRDGEGPTVYLAGAVHVGTPEFYHELQLFLDAQDIVLYEGVRPPGSGRDGRWGVERDDEVRSVVAKARARLLAHRIRERFGEAGGGSLATLYQATPEAHRAFLEPMLIDPFGTAYAYAEPTLGDSSRAPDARLPVVVGLGADGELGGDGPDADVYASPRYLPAPTERRLEGAGLQQKMADALGLQFQLAAMEHDAPHWRNSDITLKRVERSSRGAGSAAEKQTEALMQMLSGRGLLGRVTGLMVNLMGATTTTRELSKVMMIETLSRVDDILESQEPVLGDLLQIILEDRNRIVLRDLERVIKGDPGVRTIGVIYGAGHLPGIERGLVERLGYEPVATMWIPAITADLGATGMSRTEARIFRRGIRGMIEMQTRPLGGD